MVEINITMPEDCNECPFNYDGQECCASFELNPPIFFDRFRRKMFGDDYEWEGRHPRCPMKEVKENENEN